MITDSEHEAGRSGAAVRRPLLLDLFCGAGGAAVGYHRAGFDVIGVDMVAQPRYPFRFVRGDALHVLDELAPFVDAVHASPPCQDHSALRTMPTFRPHGTGGLLDETRRALVEAGRPWIIENVPGAPMRADYKLCGCMFPELTRLRRERWFETSWHGYELRPPCSHKGYAVIVTGDGARWSARRPHIPAYAALDQARAMGIDWMLHRELVQAIPPAYTEHLGRALRGELAVVP